MIALLARWLRWLFRIGGKCPACSGRMQGIAVWNACAVVDTRGRVLRMFNQIHPPRRCWRCDVEWREPAPGDLVASPEHAPTLGGVA